MSVESNHTVVALGYWPKFSTNEDQNQTNCTLFALFFPRFEQVTGDCTNSDCFIVLFVPVVIERGNYFVIGISITILKPLYKKVIP